MNFRLNDCLIVVYRSLHLRKLMQKREQQLHFITHIVPSLVIHC